MCASLNALLKAEPRCPEVPNATRCAGNDGSGLPAKYAVTSRGTFVSIDGSAVLPASGFMSAATWFPRSIRGGTIRRFIVDGFCGSEQVSARLAPFADYLD